MRKKITTNINRLFFIVIPCRQFHWFLIYRIVVFVHTSDVLAEPVSNPVVHSLSLVIRLHHHVTDLVVCLTDDFAYLTNRVNPLYLLLDEIVDELIVFVEPVWV